MQQTLTISPLKHEFWPLEGVMFSSDDEHNYRTVVCHVYGDKRFKDFINLRFLEGFDTTISPVENAHSLFACRLSGRVDSLNNSFLGFGIVFKQDFDPCSSLIVEVQGPCDYRFILKLQ